MTTGDGRATFGETVAPGFDWVYGGGLLHSERTRYQQLEVWEHVHFGRVLVLDGCVQTTERDEFTYHEMLIHPALCCRERPERVLIVGGGDGGALRRVLEHGVREAVQCEIDEAVTRVSRELLPSVSAGALDDPRTELVFGDGAAYVRDNPASFDVIFVDSTDPVGPAAVLSSIEFYTDCRRALRDDGVLVQQTGSPDYQHPEMLNAVGNMRAAFGDAETYLGAVPTYPGVIWSFTCGTDGPSVSSSGEAELAARLRDRNIRTRFYSAPGHAAAFVLPPYLSDALAGV